MRNTKTEYVSCPSCGRTLFDLQEVSLAPGFKGRTRAVTHTTPPSKPRLTHAPLLARRGFQLFEYPPTCLHAGALIVFLALAPFSLHYSVKSIDDVCYRNFAVGASGLPVVRVPSNLPSRGRTYCFSGPRSIIQ